MGILTRMNIGRKKDRSYNQSKPSLHGYIHTIDEHLHSIPRLYPNLNSPITLTSNVSSWTEGNKIEIVPINTITDYFDIHFINISGISSNGDYEIRLYQGSAGSETLIAEIPSSRNTVQSQEGSQVILTPIINPNTRISASLADSGGGNSLDIKLVYHTY